MSAQLVTLCFIVADERILLMRKKRGIGAGKINAPGGKVDAGETPLAAAIRETQEEIGVIPIDPDLRGKLWFCFKDGPTLLCHVYLAHAYEGTLVETPEAIPCWYGIDSIPYNEMWEDDQYWLPLLLTGDRFAGDVTVDGEHVLAHSISIVTYDELVSFIRLQI